MTTVHDILEYMQTLAPEHMKMEWDTVGLLCGSEKKAVQKILVALDPFEHVCQEAVEIGADLIVTHHPLIFSPCSTITDATGTGRAIMTLVANGISAINAHTNLDCAPGGVNDILAQQLGLTDIQVIAPAGTDADGRCWGLLRMGRTDEQDLNTFLSFVKQALHCDGLRYADGGKPVKLVAVGGGACASELSDVAAAGCDTFVTADVKYNQFWDAKQMGINLIDAGHFCTENPICAVLAQRLETAFPHIQVVLSKKHQDCMKFFG